MLEYRAALVTALEAIEAGDVAHAVDVLLGALDGDHPRQDRARCACGFTAEWPGLLWQHKCPVEELLRAA